MTMEHWWNDTDREKIQVLGEERCTSPTLSTINPTQTGLGRNPGLCG